MVPVIPTCEFECVSLRQNGECDCPTSLTTFQQYTVTKKKCEKVKEFVNEFIEHVKNMHPCFLEVREPTYNIGFIPTDHELVKECLSVAVKADIWQHNCQMSAIDKTCILTNLTKNTLLAALLVPYLFVRNGMMHFQLTVSFEYTTILHYPDLYFPNILRECRYILERYEEHPLKLHYPSMQTLLYYDKNCTYFCKLKVNFGDKSKTPFSQYYAFYRKYYIEGYIMCCGTKAILENKYKVTELSVMAFIECMHDFHGTNPNEKLLLSPQSYLFFEILFGAPYHTILDEIKKLHQIAPIPNLDCQKYKLPKYKTKKVYRSLSVTYLEKEIPQKSQMDTVHFLPTKLRLDTTFPFSQKLRKKFCINETPKKSSIIKCTHIVECICEQCRFNLDRQLEFIPYRIRSFKTILDNWEDTSKTYFKPTTLNNITHSNLFMTSDYTQKRLYQNNIYVPEINLSEITSFQGSILKTQLTVNDHELEFPCCSFLFPEEMIWENFSILNERGDFSYTHNFSNQQSYPILKSNQLLTKVIFKHLSVTKTSFKLVYFIFNNILGEYTEGIYTGNHKQCSRQAYVTNIINENCTLESHLYLPYCKLVTKDNKQSFLLKHHDYVIRKKQLNLNTSHKSAIILECPLCEQKLSSNLTRHFFKHLKPKCNLYIKGLQVYTFVNIEQFYNSTISKRMKGIAKLIKYASYHELEILTPSQKYAFIVNKFSILEKTILSVFCDNGFRYSITAGDTLFLEKTDMDPLWKVDSIFQNVDFSMLKSFTDFLGEFDLTYVPKSIDKIISAVYKTDICEHILHRIIHNLSINSSIIKYQFCQHILERIIDDIV